MQTHVLVGGTGTLGKALAGFLSKDESAKVRVIARGEHRLNEMRREYDPKRFSFMVCDVRDRDRLTRALTGADYVYHLAALKHVHTCEYDVIEAVRTNIDGTTNVVNACIDTCVKQAVLVSTDKAVDPTTTYGATKLVAERLFVHGNSYVGSNRHPTFHCVRYGNVLGSQGSVIGIWKTQAKANNYITIVDPSMTRFWWTVSDAAKFVLRSMQLARMGDILIPRLHSCSLQQLADILVPGVDVESISGHENEKIHEVLISNSELSRCTIVDSTTIRLSMFLPPPTTESAFEGDLSSEFALDVNEVTKCLSAV